MKQCRSVGTQILIYMQCVCISLKAHIYVNKLLSSPIIHDIMPHLSLESFRHVLFWSVKKATSYGKYVQVTKSYISGAKYIIVIQY